MTHWSILEKREGGSSLTGTFLIRKKVYPSKQLECSERSGREEACLVGMFWVDWEEKSLSM